MLELFKTNKNKYSEMKSQSLRDVENFINTYVESFLIDIQKYEGTFLPSVNEFKENVNALDPLDEPKVSQEKIDKLLTNLNNLDFPLRSNFYYELIDRIKFAPIISQLGDEVFERIMFRLGAGEEYKNFSVKVKETLDKLKVAQTVEEVK